MRTDIQFNTEDGVTLRGWIYTGSETRAPAPTIVMAHGFSATKEMHLDAFAEFFAAGGLNVLVYDNRNSGESDGEPRGEIDPWQQIRDYRDAVTHAASWNRVDSHRIGIWGSSYSGGHVLAVAALDRRVKCVVSQVPLVSGSENARRLVRSDQWAGLRKAFNDDRAARMAGEAPAMIPVVGEADGDPCVLPTADSREFFQGITAARETHWVNAVTLRSVEMFTEYEPGCYIDRISPTPLMMVVARGDHLTPQDLTLRAYQAALEPKRLLVLPGGHFDAYVGDAFAMSAPAQRDWFAQHLR